VVTDKDIQHVHITPDTPLLAVLGTMLLQDWVEKSQQMHAIPSPEVSGLHEVAIRLHALQHDGFKHNERVRLRQVLHALQRQPNSYVVLLPMLGQHAQDADIQARIQKTQKDIEQFLHERGIARSRILLRLPEQGRRVGNMTGIQLQVLDSGK